MCYRDQEIDKVIQEVSGSVVPQPHLILTPTEDFETSKFLPFMKVFINRIYSNADLFDN